MLFVRHEGVVRAFVRALQPSLSDADDVLQETFLTVSRKAASFEPGTNFVAWACGIARLKVLEHHRQQKRATVLSEAAIVALAEDAPSENMTRMREAALGRCLEKIAPRLKGHLLEAYVAYWQLRLRLDETVAFPLAGFPWPVPFFLEDLRLFSPSTTLPDRRLNCLPSSCDDPGSSGGLISAAAGDR